MAEAPFSWDVIPDIPLDAIVRRVPGLDLQTCRLVSRKWKGAVDRFLPHVNWMRRCVYDVPETVLYQIVRRLGLEITGEVKGDFVWKVIEWRLRLTANWIRSVPIFRSKAELDFVREHPTAINFDPKAALQAFGAQRWVAHREPSAMDVLDLETRWMTMMASGDVIIGGSHDGTIVVVDMETGNVLSETYSRNPCRGGVIVRMALVDSRGRFGVRKDGSKGYRMEGCSSYSRHDIVLAGTSLGDFIAVRLGTGRPDVVRASSGEGLRSTFVLEDYVHDVGTLVGDRIYDIVYIPHNGDVAILGSGGCYFFPLEAAFLPGELNHNANFRAVQIANIDVLKRLQVFRSDAVIAHSRTFSYSGLDVSIDGKKFFNCADASENYNKEFFQMDLLGNLLAVGSRCGIVRVYYLPNSSKSFRDLKFWEPDFEIRHNEWPVAEVFPYLHERNCIRGLFWTHWKGKPTLLVMRPRQILKLVWSFPTT